MMNYKLTDNQGIVRSNFTLFTTEVPIDTLDLKYPIKEWYSKPARFHFPYFVGLFFCFTFGYTDSRAAIIL